MVSKSTYNSSSVRVTGLKPTTVAAFESVLFGLIGLAVGIMYSLGAFVEFAGSTDSLLRGLAFGLTQGFIAIVLIPLVYSAIGWVIGFLHGFVLDALLTASGGIELETAEK